MSDVMYAPVANSPMTAIGNARPILPGTLPHGIASASVCALRSWKMQTRRIEPAPIPMKSASKCRYRTTWYVSKGMNLLKLATPQPDCTEDRESLQGGRRPEVDMGGGAANLAP